ncbi:helix-turn-helix domain-containing protein [Salibacter halophilus]|uniref:Helix-turn-helix domain-containing protein n=1 Tax=Salibacter halophilus TaxID=1803916 RepID=A0A6N6MA43_9FLAO|nr:helix-turn-helix transcriptional regulator [Salibacter halophilus]KAB1065136.1 helix-turn-helix domain-containing protein [Salibacter halophilus]
MNYLGARLRELRESRGLLLRQVAAAMEVDTALVSKLERGERKANRDQVNRLSSILKVPEKELLLLWLADKIADDISHEPLAMEAMRYVEQRLKETSND